FFSGDTKPVDVIIEKAKCCDILVHEAYCAAGMPHVPERWQWYFPTVHTSGIEVGEVAAKVNPGLLILNHQMCFGGTTDADLIQEVRDGGFEGEVVSGQDLQLF
ncbi:MAG: MBL fold metallo-hydrolase, partial [Chloroflexota bacterium]